MHTYGRFTLTSRSNPAGKYDRPNDIYLSNSGRSRPKIDSCAKQQSTPGPLQSLTLPRRLTQLPDTRLSEHLPVLTLPFSLPCFASSADADAAQATSTVAQHRHRSRQHAGLTCDQSSRAVESGSAEQADQPRCIHRSPAPLSYLLGILLSATRVPVVARVPYTSPRTRPAALVPVAAGDYSIKIFPRTRH